MRIVVYGGSGTTGRLIARELRRRGADVVLAGRDAARLEAAADALDDARIAVAPVDDPIALATVCEGASVIVGSAGPFGPVGEPLLEAAIASGAHYLDIAGEQAFLRAMYERHEAEARHAGVCAISGLGFEVTLGDLAAGWAAAALAGADGDRDRADGGDDAADPVRATDAPTIAVDDPLDEVAVTYALDDFVPTPGTQLSTI
ncbi:MAG: saccharopine dehydrogenase NADP-binding domain-containing protein, partial [Myxococcales bacterium]|nr:saccharopine dehydrogenase NADP-binding domain-containing protein [Myxococcales bacterium]